MNATTGIIILAAGDSKRMGQCKFMLRLANGNTFLENILSQLTHFPFSKIIIVTQSKHLLSINKLYATGLPSNVELIYNDYPDQERFYSLQLGINAAKTLDFCFIHNADNPFISSSTLTSLYENRNKADYISPRFGERGGHPILLNKETLSELLFCKPTAYLNEELAKKTRYNVQVNDESICVDIDTLDDYKNYLKQNVQFN